MLVERQLLKSKLTHAEQQLPTLIFEMAVSHRKLA